MRESTDAGLLAWLAFGVVVVGAVAFALFSYLGTVVAAVFAYYAARPVYRWLDRHVARHDAVLAWLTILVFVVPLLALLAYTGVVLVAELQAVLASERLDVLREVLDQYVGFERADSLRSILERALANPTTVFDSQTLSVLSSVLGPVGSVAGLVFAVGSRLFLLSVFVYYLLKDDDVIAAWFRDTVGWQHSTVEFLDAVDADLENIFFGNLATIVATSAIAVATFLALDAVSPPATTLFRPVLLGVLVGVATLIPIVGMKIVWVPAALALFADAALQGGSLWFPVAFTVVTFLVVDAMPDFFVRSFLSAGDIRMGLVLFGYVLGTMVWGWMGLFLGPLVLVVFVRFAQDALPEVVWRLQAR